MPLYANTGFARSIHPEGEDIAARLEEWKDLGARDFGFGEKPYLLGIFSTAYRLKSGERAEASKLFNNVLTENSNLCKDLRAWRVLPASPQEWPDFDLLTLVGTFARLDIEHQDKGGKLRATITRIRPATADTERLWNDCECPRLAAEDQQAAQAGQAWLLEQAQALIDEVATRWREQNTPELNASVREQKEQALAAIRQAVADKNFAALKAAHKRFFGPPPPPPPPKGGNGNSAPQDPTSDVTCPF
jgi:hypothetical protein